MNIILVTMLLLLCILLLYLFAVAPRISRKHMSYRFCNVNYAHRGFFDNNLEKPENSLPAFMDAVNHNYGIELDVQATKDGKIIVFHDNTLRRMCDINNPVWEKTYADLQQLRLLHTNEKIPLFSDVLKLVNGKVPLLIEIKLPGKNTNTCALVNDILKDYLGPYCIESFNTLAVLWYRKHRPDVIRGQLSANLMESAADRSLFLSFMVTNLLTNFLGRPDFISYCYKDINNLGFYLNKNIFHAVTMAWTIRTPEAYSKCLDHFDSLIFEGFDIEKDVKKL